MQDFRDSPNNFVLASGTHPTTEGAQASKFDFAHDKEGNKIQRYDAGLFIKTTQADRSSTDSKTIEVASKEAKSTYIMNSADCSDVMIRSVGVSENSKGEEIKNGEFAFPISPELDEIPNIKFNKIADLNRDAINCSAGLIPDNKKP